MNTTPSSLRDVSRQLLTDAEWGVLGTHSHGHAGFPFSSMVQFALDAEGRVPVERAGRAHAELAS